MKEIREGGGGGFARTDIDAIGANRLHTLRLVSGAQVYVSIRTFLPYSANSGAIKTIIGHDPYEFFGRACLQPPSRLQPLNQTMLLNRLDPDLTHGLPSRYPRPRLYKV